MSAVTSKVDKLLIMPPDSISEGVIFQNFPWGHAPRPPSTVTSKVVKLLKMPSDSIPEGLIFQNFLWEHALDPLVLVCFAHYECKYAS